MKRDPFNETGCLKPEHGEAGQALQGNTFADLGFAKVDLSREQRNGYPEVIYGEGKTAEQIIGIIQAMRKQTVNILCTRLSSDKFETIKKATPDAVYYKTARCALVNRAEVKQTQSYIAIVTAGTSDVPIAEEAAVTAEAYGNRVARIYDVGVAGIHRLFARLDVIRGAKVVICIAGMEGALASVVGGLIDKPLIAVPTSVGYGTNLKGVTALLTMLNSCASGITVVNIDNGFGAAYSASMINHL
ncbi:nickel pincer cofactor biosynthesis protein LarB [Sporolactobacillus terrae]|uniref:1-(5-phosphoribosyl)-5-amino-4-imidazole-carboxylate carboxylase n=1 Tax=Sporolactobacillus terrae TaxID=269673 RepID=A0ABX5Q9Y2_9BACL|nr:nickel pincer cofactor biosynthesis protein LarB [Sporolactobacillus terrae]QAA23476.1 1-(5-phosphoribosyl)-5-amino-4-imidazole-carboxylate carboxylase [Sporolactobacillus terrae]QAA26446.1 1-(5-phosphoribosyl)-5-amino-4-imidazole-carboxylate carboxylase [Sporolactobacillus terrae]UAK15538.1 nickel pincer cofactor biosynthesis protein LarB [Sporolactobacillus terrae]